MKTMLLISALLIATACQQKEPVRVKSNPAMESNTLVDIPEEELATKEMKGFLCDMSSNSGVERVFLRFTRKANGDRRLHIRKLQSVDAVEPFYPIIDGYRLLPLTLKKETPTTVNYASEAEIIDPVTSEGMKVKSAHGQVELISSGDFFSGHISIDYKAGTSESVRLVATLKIAELENCTGPEMVKMGTK